jgi:hypothetical protein
VSALVLSSFTLHVVMLEVDLISGIQFRKGCWLLTWNVRQYYDIFQVMHKPSTILFVHGCPFSSLLMCKLC